jgi:CheY-like chemotaxis protein
MATEPPLAADEASGEPTSPVSGMILVAEDHPPSRQALAKLLQWMGYRVLEAADGREAAELARRECPLAVLMDVNMPGGGGIEATVALRSDPETRDLPVFALTGDVSADVRRRIAAAGADGFLEKPVTLEALERALAGLRDRR